MTNVADFHCSKCGAHSGQRCRTSSGYRYEHSNYHHIARLDNAAQDRSQVQCDDCGRMRDAYLLRTCQACGAKACGACIEFPCVGCPEPGSPPFRERAEVQRIAFTMTAKKLIINARAQDI